MAKKLVRLNKSSRSEKDVEVKYHAVKFMLCNKFCFVPHLSNFGGFLVKFSGTYVTLVTNLFQLLPLLPDFTCLKT